MFLDEERHRKGLSTRRSSSKKEAMRFVGVPAGGGLGEWRRWLGEGRQVVVRLCEEVERLPARSIEEWRAEEPDSLGMGLSAEMVRAVAFSHCFGLKWMRRRLARLKKDRGACARASGVAQWRARSRIGGCGR